MEWSGIDGIGTKSPHPKSFPRFFTRVMCHQKDDPVALLQKKVFSHTAQISHVLLLIDLMNCNLQKQVTAHVPSKDIERATDADIGRKEAEFGPIVLASNHLRGRLGSAHMVPPELSIMEVILY